MKLRGAHIVIEGIRATAMALRWPRDATQRGVVLLVTVGVIAFGSAWSASAQGGQRATPIATPVVTSCPDAWTDDGQTRTRTLRDDCTTDRPIEIPRGWSFDGGAHAIHVVDPTGGRFRGGVIAVQGGTTRVRNVSIDGSGLAPGCSPETAVMGVLYVGAGGIVEDVTVIDVKRGQGDRCGFGIVVGGPNAEPVSLIGNTILAPGDTGIVVSGATVDARDNVIEDAGDNGIIYCCAGTSGTIAGNTIRNARYAGISLEDGATAEVVANDVIDAGAIGLLVFLGATAQTIDGNRISGGEAGIVVSDAGTSATIDGNDIEGPAKDGIYVQNGAEATVLKTVIANAGRSGITVSSAGTRGLIRGNTVLAARMNGIVVEQEASATIQDNIVEDTAVNGIFVRPSADADVTGNTVSGLPGATVDSLFGPVGIRYGSGGSGRVDGNSISGYLSKKPASAACAIAIELLAGQVDLGQNTFPPPGNALNLCHGVPPEEWAIPRPSATPAATPGP
jgi:parallel beta-helix repeat protein